MKPAPKGFDAGRDKDETVMPAQDAPSGTAWRWIANQGRRGKEAASRTTRHGRGRGARHQGRSGKDAAGMRDIKDEAARRQQGCETSRTTRQGRCRDARHQGRRDRDNAPSTMQGRQMQHRHGRRAGQQRQRTARKGGQARDGRARDRRPGSERRTLARCGRRSRARPGDRAAGGRCGRRAAVRRTSTAPAATVIEVFQRGSKA